MNQRLVPIVVGTHPDLFGPDTPLIAEVPITDAVKVFEVDLACRNTVSVRVVAVSDKDARLEALRRANSGLYDGDGYWSIMGSSQEEPTEDEINTYLEGLEKHEH